MKKKADVIAGKILEFPLNTVFSIYTRRSNCKKKLIHAGKSLDKALDIFHKLKVFDKDYKYLMFRQGGVDQIIYRNAGEGHRAKMQGSNRGKPHEIRKRMQIESIPITLWDSFNLAVQNIVIEGKEISVSRVLPRLVSYFINLSEEEKIKLLEDNYLEVVRHTYLSGGDNTEAVKKFLVKELEEEEGLL